MEDDDLTRATAAAGPKDSLCRQDLKLQVVSRAMITR
jgi:hypothetical protein